MGIWGWEIILFLSNPHHQFIGINLFDISLTIENNKGCVEELLIQDYIKTVGPYKEILFLIKS